jgi:hypothetical protein
LPPPASTNPDTITAEKAKQLLLASKRGKLPIVNGAGELLALATRALFKEDARVPQGGALPPPPPATCLAFSPCPGCGRVGSAFCGGVAGQAATRCTAQPSMVVSPCLLKGHGAPLCVGTRQ